MTNQRKIAQQGSMTRVEDNSTAGVENRAEDDSTAGADDRAQDDSTAGVDDRAERLGLYAWNAVIRICVRGLQVSGSTDHS